MTQRLIDLSHPLGAETPPWPGNPSTSVEVLNAIPANRPAGVRGTPGELGYRNVPCVTNCNHTGTHMDAPTHYYQGLRTIDQVPLSQCIGPCSFLRLQACAPNTMLDVEDLEPIQESLKRTRKLVVETGWSSRWSEPETYFRHYPGLTEEAALWLVDCGIELFGFDSPSVDYRPNPAHYALLGAQAVIVENLTNLDEIEGEAFELIVTPLPFQGLDGSPVRAVAKIGYAH